MREPEFFLGRPVRSLQTMLRHISDQDPRILPLIPDGRYGQNTYASVRSFQEAFGLPPTGEADAVTWDAIAAVHHQIYPERIQPATIPAWSAGQSIQPGQFNYHIYLIQAMLAALSHFFPELSVPQLTGALDSVTEAGLRWVQRAGSEQETGILDTKTWHLLNGLYRTMTGNGSPETIQ